MASNTMNQGGDEDDTEILQFNLTNPEQLTEQLEHAHLNDEETDILLKEAMRVNAQLKEALRTKQLEDDGQKPRNVRARAPVGPPEPLAPRNPKQSALPPIVSKSDKHQSGGAGSPGHKHSKSKNPLDGQRGTSVPKRKSSANKSRPVWDDRFSFG